MRQQLTVTDFPHVTGELVPATAPRPNAALVRVRKANVSGHVKAHASRAARGAARQTLRAVHPVTIGRLAWITMRGAFKLTAGIFRFLIGNDKSDLRKVKPDKHHELVKNRQQGALVIVLAIGLALFLAPRIWTYTAGGALIFVCICIGRQKETVMADTPNMFGAHDALIRDAFVHARLAKTADDVKLVAPVQREGQTWTTLVQLPPGVDSDKAILNRKNLASALRMPANRLLVLGAGHAGLVRLRASECDPLSGPPVYNPIVSSGHAVDLWKGLPIGVDDAGQVVSIELVFSGILIGGLPRRGKTVLASNILLGGLFDPHCELWIVDGKGLDSVPLLPFATRSLISSDLEKFSDLMDELETEMDRRYARLAELKVDKLSREICHREMPLIMLSIDELARYSASSEKAAKRAMNTLRNIVSVGPACGIIPVLATQKPGNKVVPTDIRDLIPARAAVLCSTRAQSNTILGDESSVSATDLPGSVKGATWLMDGDEARMMRPYLVDSAEMQKAVEHLSTGIRTVTDPLSEVVAAMRGAEIVPSAVLAERLGTTQKDLAYELKKHGIFPRQARQTDGESNLRSYKMSDFPTATRPATDQL